MWVQAYGGTSFINLETAVVIEPVETSPGLWRNSVRNTSFLPGNYTSQADALAAVRILLYGPEV